MKIPREIVQDLFYGDVGTRGVSGSTGSSTSNTQALKNLLAEKQMNVQFYLERMHN